MKIIAEFSNSNVATKCCHYPLKFFTCLHQLGGAGLRGSDNFNVNYLYPELSLYFDRFGPYNSDFYQFTRSKYTTNKDLIY